MEVDGFDYVTREDVLAEMDLSDLTPSARNTTLQLSAPEANGSGANLSNRYNALYRDMPMYRGEATLRHARRLTAYQRTNPAPMARANANTIASHQLGLLVMTFPSAMAH